MALNYKKCDVCGKEYKACNPIGIKTDKFRWQSVTCSPECGSIYLERLLVVQTGAPSKTVDMEPEILIDVDLYTPESDDDYDIWYDEDESDNEE